MPTAPAARVLPHPGNNAWQLRSPSGIRKRHGNIVHSERLPTACAASDLSSCSAGFSQLHPGGPSPVVERSGVAESSSTPSCVSNTSSPLLHASTSSSTDALLHRLPLSCVRIDGRLPIEATVPENVILPPPASQTAQHGYGGRNSAAPFATSRYFGRRRGAQNHRAPNAPSTAVLSSAAGPTNATEGTSCAASASACSVVSFCCNVHVNLKASGFRDDDSFKLTRLLEKRLLSSAPPPENPQLSASNHVAPLAGLPSASAKQDGVQSGGYRINSKKSKGPPASVSSSIVYFVSLDLSENELTCTGIEVIVQWFIRHARTVRLRVLKVYRNFISDAGAIALARLIARQPSPLEELHLSHNSIQMRGAEALFRSIGTAQSDCAGNGNARPKPFYLYPRPDPNRQEFLPVWIRLEYNHICDTYALLQKWEQELRVERAFDPQLKLACFADRLNHPHGSKDPHCSPARCLRAVNGQAPLLHLYSFHHQSSGENTSALLAAAAAVSGAPLTRRPSAVDTDRADSTNDEASASVLDSGKPSRRAPDNSSTLSAKRAGGKGGTESHNVVEEKSRRHNGSKKHSDAKANAIVSPESGAAKRHPEVRGAAQERRLSTTQHGPPPSVPIPAIPPSGTKPLDTNAFGVVPQLEPLSTTPSLTVASSENNVFPKTDTERCPETSCLKASFSDGQDCSKKSNLETSSLSSATQWKAFYSLDDNRASALDANAIFELTTATRQSPSLTPTVGGSAELTLEGTADEHQSKLQFWMGISRQPLTSQLLQHRASNNTDEVAETEALRYCATYETTDTNTPGTLFSNDEKRQRRAAALSDPDGNPQRAAWQKERFVQDGKPEIVLNGASLRSFHKSQPVLTGFNEEVSGSSTSTSSLVCAENHFSVSDTKTSTKNAAFINAPTPGHYTCQNVSAFPCGMPQFGVFEKSASNEDVARQRATSQFDECNNGCYSDYASNFTEQQRSGQENEHQAAERGASVPHNPVLQPTTHNANSSQEALQTKEAPLYIFFDASAFMEMHNLWKNDQLNLFSFPGLLALYQKQLLIPASHKTPKGGQKSYAGPNHVLSRPSLSRIVLICIDAVHEKVVKLVETQPYLTSSVAEVQAKFVEPLARCGVIEKLESLCDRVTYPKWMMLNKTLREEANALNAFSPDALRVIDVACVWTYHLDCMTSGQMFSREDPGFINHTTSAAPCVLQRTNPTSLFVTANPKVEKFFSHLIALTATKSGLATPAQTREAPHSSTLLCIHVDRFNALLRDGFPRLESLLRLPGAFEHSAVTASRAVADLELLSAEAVRHLLYQKLHMSYELCLDPKSLFSLLTSAHQKLLPTVSPADPRRFSITKEVLSDPACLPALLQAQEPQKLHPLLSPSFFNEPSATVVEASELTTTDQEVYRLRTSNNHLREEVRRAYILVSEIVNSQLRYEATSTSAPCDNDARFPPLNATLLRHCQTECQHWRDVLFNQASSSVPTKSSVRVYPKPGTALPLVAPALQQSQPVFSHHAFAPEMLQVAPITTGAGMVDHHHSHFSTLISPPGMAPPSRLNVPRDANSYSASLTPDKQFLFEQASLVHTPPAIYRNLERQDAERVLDAPTSGGTTATTSNKTNNMFFPHALSHGLAAQDAAVPRRAHLTTQECTRTVGRQPCESTHFPWSEETSQQTTTKIPNYPASFYDASRASPVMCAFSPPSPSKLPGTTEPQDSLCQHLFAVPPQNGDMSAINASKKNDHPFRFLI